MLIRTLSGREHLDKTGNLAQLGQENVYRSTSMMGNSALKAYQDATLWLEQEKK